MNRQRAMLHRHDQPVVGFGGDVQAVGEGGTVDDQRVIAGGLEGLWRSLENTLAGVGDHRQLAVHELRRAFDMAAKGLADRLMAEADAEQRHLGVAGRLDEIEADPASFGVQGPGDRTIASGPADSTWPTLIWSLRCTTVSAPSSPR